MMPPSHAATRKPPNRGETATTSPAAISTMPTMCMASPALPGIRSLNSGPRYLGQSLIMTVEFSLEARRLVVAHLQLTREAALAAAKADPPMLVAVLSARRLDPRIANAAPALE